MALRASSLQLASGSYGAYLTYWGGQNRVLSRDPPCGTRNFPVQLRLSSHHA